MIAGFLLRCRREAHGLQLADDSMHLERLNASLLSHVADVDGTLKVSSATPMPSWHEKLLA